MTDLQKLTYSQILYAALFWVPVVVLYLQYRGLTLEQIFLFVSAGYFLIVLFEYPSGVIGDYFSHKKTVAIGYFITGCISLLFAVPGSFWYYLLLQIPYSLGLALVSGSDTALIHNCSKNFKQDIAHINFLKVITNVVAIFLGGFLGLLHLALPGILSGIALFFAYFLTLSIKNTPTKGGRVSGNIFSTAKEGFRISWKNAHLRWIVLLASILGMVFLTFKWIFNPYLDELTIPFVFWGTIISLFMIVRSIGIKTYGKLSPFSLSTSSLLFVLSLAATSMTEHVSVSLLGFTSLAFFYGYVETQVTVAINKHVDDSVRASVLSLKSLVARLLGGLYLLYIGYVLEHISFAFLYLSTSVVVGIIVCITLFLIAQKKYSKI